MKKFSEMKGGPAFAAKLRSKARAALMASQLLGVKNSNNNNKDSMKKNNDGNEVEVKDLHDDVEVEVVPKILAVDLPGMSFITLFCDDQKVSKIRFIWN